MSFSNDKNVKKHDESIQNQNIANWSDEDYKFYDSILEELSDETDESPTSNPKNADDVSKSWQNFQEAIKKIKDRHLGQSSY